MTALALSCEPSAGGTGFPLVALVDRTTGTVAVLACPFPRNPCTTNSQGSAAAFNGTTAARDGVGVGGVGGGDSGGNGGGGGVDGGIGVGGVGGVVGVGGVGVVGGGDAGVGGGSSYAQRTRGIGRGGNGSTAGGNGTAQLGSLSAVDPLRLVAVWPCLDKVTSLEAVEATSSGDRDRAERVDDVSGRRRVERVFMLGTAAGAVFTVGVSRPHGAVRRG